MTTDTPARVSDDARRKAYCDHAVETAMRLVETCRDPTELVARISAQILNARQDERDHAGALTQAQAERIAALEARLTEEMRVYVATWKDADNDRIKWRAKAEAAESSLAASQAKVEGLENVWRLVRAAAKAYHEQVSRDFSDTDYDRDGVLAQVDIDLIAALAALPEAKPAVQEGE